MKEPITDIKKRYAEESSQSENVSTILRDAVYIGLQQLDKLEEVLRLMKDMRGDSSR